MRDNAARRAAGQPAVLPYRHVYCPARGAFRQLRLDELELGSYVKVQERVLEGRGNMSMVKWYCGSGREQMMTHRCGNPPPAPRWGRVTTPVTLLSLHACMHELLQLTFFMSPPWRQRCDKHMLMYCCRWRRSPSPSRCYPTVPVSASTAWCTG